MAGRIDITGRKFGRLAVVAPDHREKNWKWFWRCRCDCGKETIVGGDELRRGDTKSCGCLRRERFKTHYPSRGNKRHGMTGTPEYTVWNAMKDRCGNPSSKRYADYGGRGIRVCERWMDFAAFYADMGSRPAGRSKRGRALFSIERIDNNGNYEKVNCRWATMKEQLANRRPMTMTDAQREASRLNLAKWRQIRWAHKHAD
jgi:hypothetical protein